MNLPLPECLKRRPRILNVLHGFGLIRTVTSTIEPELACLERHARGRKLAVEIGTAQGSSAVRIAGALASGGKLYCIDPYPEGNPDAQICRRELERNSVLERTTFLREFSTKVADRIPREC